MAKMFYSLEEAAQKLGVDQDEVKRLASTGKLQQFRDRDKLMFKRDQIDALAGEVGTTGVAHVVGGGDDETGSLPLDDTGDAIDLKQADLIDTKSSKEDTKARTGISVFDADEVEHADPMAQTQVSRSQVDDDELVLESVGSGSGLLDLTRESDDTSLGAELLEEIYPGSGEGSDSKLEPATASSGAYELGDTDASASGLDNLQPSATAAPSAAISSTGLAGMSSAPVAYTPAAAEAYDPVGSGWTGGALFGAGVGIVVVLIIIMAAIMGGHAQLTNTLASNLWAYVGGLFGVMVVFAVIGLFVGKAASK
ncbi:MAG: hypothetical protein GC164_05630 [Phycisphaera sp.]|nr:hypothetical protein [Phycisphaera sp.]